MKERYELLNRSRPAHSAMARLPVRPGLFLIYFRLLAVGVHITGYLVFTRNQRKKMYRAWRGQVLSKYR